MNVRKKHSVYLYMRRLNKNRIMARLTGVEPYLRVYAYMDVGK